MSELINIFPLSIYKSKIILKEVEKRRMIEEILSMKEKKEATRNKGSAWTGDKNGYEFFHKNPIFKKLFSEVKKNIAEYIKVLGIDCNLFDIYFQRSWATISDSQEKIFPHRHTQSHISFAYYLQKNENESKITFIDETLRNEFIPSLFISKSVGKQNFFLKRSQYNSPHATLDVKEEDIVIFPSKSLHGTEAKTENSKRISISADISCFAKDSDALEHLTPPISKWSKF